jgi:hypothetical protein
VWLPGQAALFTRLGRIRHSGGYMATVATAQASGFKKGMNKVVLNVPAALVPLAKFWGSAAGVWDRLLPSIESQAAAKGLNVSMPRSSFYMNAAGAVRSTKADGFQYIQRKYYNAELKKFVVWVKVNS